VTASSSEVYVIGIPLIAKQMLEHVPEVGLYVPVRIYVHEAERGTTRIDYDKGWARWAGKLSESLSTGAIASL